MVFLVDHGQIAALEILARNILEEYGCPGLALGLSERGKHMYTLGFGYRDVTRLMPVTGETIFGIGSLTKSFTCVSIMQLQEAGKLKVDTPLVEILPGLRLAGQRASEAITLHHLMTHTAGLPPLPGLALALSADSDTEPSPRSGVAAKPMATMNHLLDFLADHPFTLLASPGRVYSYSNEGYALLGCVIEQVAGQTYPSYVRENIITPLGLTRTIFDLPEVIDTADLSTLYVAQGVGGKVQIKGDSKWWNAPVYSAAGMLRSCAADLMRYAELFVASGRVGSERILTPASVELMCIPHVALPTRSYYGYGLSISHGYRGFTLMEHSGSSKGASAHLCMVPGEGLVSVALANLAGTPAKELARRTIDLSLGRGDESEWGCDSAYSCPSERLRDYHGAYQSEEGVHLVVWADRDGLVFRVDGLHCPARMVGRDLFLVRVKAVDFPACFLSDETDHITSVFWGGRVIPKVV